MTVALFAPLAAMELARAGLLVLGLKLALLAGLVWAWTRRLGPWVPLVTATLWAYAIQIDLNSGNVSVFEQALLWSGVAALLAGRRLAFAGLIACAAVFKLELISMAALALVVDPRHGWRPLVLALAGLSAYLLLGLALFPGPSESWYVAAQDATFSEGGYNAPSLAAALLHLGATPALVVLAVLIVIAGSIGVLWRAREQPVVTRLMFAILALTLTWPRLKNYGFIVLIPPAACTITWLWGRSERWPAKLAIAGLLAALLLLPREFEALGQQNFLPTLLLVLLWIAGAATLLGSRR
nr:glycosyltransferase 87 family protein [Pseudenhygromyxa sp. WMMC2535]